MSRTRVKVCGITEERDAVECVLLGVDALGFNFWPRSPRFIEPESARRIVERLPALVAKVGVFVDAPLIRVLEVARSVGLTAVQLHGDESPSYGASLAPLAWYKALRVGPAFEAEALERYPCNTFLLDGSSPASRGGTGARFDWRRARTLSVYGRILVAGGLDPTNVALAIEQARPYGVDVASGVEVAPGKKDLDRVEAFVEAVRRADRRIAAAEAGAGSEAPR